MMSEIRFDGSRHMNTSPCMTFSLRIPKETYRILKETYRILKETCRILKETETY